LISAKPIIISAISFSFSSLFTAPLPFRYYLTFPFINYKCPPPYIIGFWFRIMQYKLSKGGEVIRTDIQVGDDTLPFFSVSLWKKQMGTMVIAGDILLLQSKQGHPFFAICFNFHNIYKINWGLRFCFIDSLSMGNFTHIFGISFHIPIKYQCLEFLIRSFLRLVGVIIT